MKTITTKQLKTKINNYADFSETVERFAIYEDNKRIGTVYHHIINDGENWFDPYRGSNGDGQIVVKDNFICRCDDMTSAIAEVRNLPDAPNNDRMWS